MNKTKRLWTLMLASWIGLAAVAGCERSGGKAGAKSASAKAEGKGSKEDGAPAKAGAAAGGDEHGHAHAHGEGGDEVKLTPEAVRANGIQLAAAKKEALVATVTAPARIAFNAEQMAHVGSVVQGRVAELKVRVGDRVKKDDPLVVVDSPGLGEAQSEFLQRRTTLEFAQPAVALAKDAYERADKLLKENQGISLTEVQRRLAEYQAAQGALGNATAAVLASENKLQLLGMGKEAIQNLATSKEINARYTVHAPIAGQVIEREVTLGELVGPDKEKLLTLADLGTVWVLADVPEARLGQVAVGSKVKITVAAGGEEAFDGAVSYIAPQLDPTTRTARVRVEVKNAGGKLLPGMFATAEIAAPPDQAAEAVIAVPEEAVQTVEGEPAVFVPVKNEPNTFATRQVGVGLPVKGMVPVLAGLDEGEQYVAAGSFILKAELGKAGAAHEH